MINEDKYIKRSSTVKNDNKQDRLVIGYTYWKNILNTKNVEPTKDHENYKIFYDKVRLLWDGSFKSFRELLIDFNMM